MRGDLLGYGVDLLVDGVNLLGDGGGLLGDGGDPISIAVGRQLLRNDQAAMEIQKYHQLTDGHNDIGRC